MNYSRINNYRMAAYGAFAVGLINLRYQTGSDQNLLKSMALVIPGVLLLALTFIDAGKNWLATKAAAQVVTVIWVLLVLYSFIL
jgi:hypothetical protein